MDELNDSPWYSAMNIFLQVSSSSLRFSAISNSGQKQDIKMELVMFKHQYFYFTSEKKSSCNFSISQTEFVF